MSTILVSLSVVAAQIVTSFECNIISANGSAQQCEIPSYWNTSNYSCSDWNLLVMDPIDTTEFDRNENKNNKWTTVMWFTDSVWSGTLITYQQILQHSFTFAIFDLHQKWGDEIDSNSQHDVQVTQFDIQDVLVDVNFFLGFCLLDDESKCTTV